LIVDGARNQPDLLPHATAAWPGKQEGSSGTEINGFCSVSPAAALSTQRLDDA
jgi:hypothetical protein